MAIQFKDHGNMKTGTFYNLQRKLYSLSVKECEQDNKMSDCQYEFEYQFSDQDVSHELNINHLIHC